MLQPNPIFFLYDYATISKLNNLHQFLTVQQKRIIQELKELLPEFFTFPWKIENYQNANYCNYTANDIIVVWVYSIN